ncbi:MAG: hypothetical protein COV44_08325 [Deltaproteobacteria bacterium CG11_big_fil_rev_8_21_14_0_20_45_16]|nr:MAG: hypothetical protein COV44_08325 [Deltaproteobacteria bacterium CG11_big_fil_rev_8_21_14_0_20_45_16]
MKNQAGLVDWISREERKTNFLLGDDSINYPKQITEYSVASGNAYYHIESMIDWIQQAEPNWSPHLNLVATTNVGGGFSFCNAYYRRNMGEMVFLASSPNCPNAAYSTIIRHEFGHAFLESLGFQEGEIEDFFGFHEGVADTVAALSFDTYCMGLDFDGDGAGCYRDYSNLPYERPYVWPAGMEYGPHQRGMPLAASFWELRMALGGKYFLEVGRTIAQNLFVTAIMQNKNGLTPQIGLDVERVDAEIYHGAHQNLIRKTFGARGLYPR